MGVGKEGMRRGSGSKGMGGRWRERNEGEVEGKEQVGGGYAMSVGKDGRRRKVRNEKGKDRKEWRRVERYG